MQTLYVFVSSWYVNRIWTSDVCFTEDIASAIERGCTLCPPGTSAHASWGLGSPRRAARFSHLRPSALFNATAPNPPRTPTFTVRRDWSQTSHSFELRDGVGKDRVTAESAVRVTGDHNGGILPPADAQWPTMIRSRTVHPTSDGGLAIRKGAPRNGIPRTTAATTCFMSSAFRQLGRLDVRPHTLRFILAVLHRRVALLIAVDRDGSGSLRYLSRCAESRAVGRDC